jgi:hypothetical protein
LDSTHKEAPDTAAQKHARDKLWSATFETYYDSYLQELSSEKLLERWGNFDDVTKVLVALAASGSAIAGWTLWSEPGFKYIWAIFAGFVAVMSIVHAALKVPERVARHLDSKADFAALRIALETFRHQMQIFPSFSVEDYNKKYLQYRERYQTLVSKLKSDFLSTQAMVKAAQIELNGKVREFTSQS